MKSIKISHYALISGFLVFASSLYLYRLNELMTFIGDQGWFYLSAREMLVDGAIPLVGIPSSHPWLHQGAYWTYLLSGALFLGKFHPVAGGILAAFFGLLTVMAIYYIGNKMFSWKVGIIAAALYATSPLAILHARMPYHTSPISFFSIIYFYFLYKWIDGKIVFFPLSIFVLAILYNFEIATIVFVFPLFCILLYGMWKKKDYFKKLLTLKNFFLSSAAFIIPMFPMLIYDTTHGYPQTIKVILWIGYRILVLFGYPPLQKSIEGATTQEFFIFTSSLLTKLIFVNSSLIAIALLVLSFLYYGKVLVNKFRKNKIEKSYMIIALWLLFGLGGYIITHVTSEAYLPMIFPVFFLLLAIFFLYLYIKSKILGIALLLLVILSNLSSYQETINKTITLSQRMKIADEILEKVGNKPYMLKGRGEGSEFSSFTMNYEYLLWWKGNPPSENAEIIVALSEKDNNAKYSINRKNELE